jgi:hypothetical protein
MNQHQADAYDASAGAVTQADYDRKPRFLKISATGEAMAADATGHAAVLDRSTGLMWAAIEMPRRGNHAKCLKFCENLELAGFKDWRMPTRAELLSLVDDTRHSPAIDTGLFPGCKSDWYWTSTPWAQSPSGNAWYVFFSDGDAGYGNHGYYGFVRAVRPGQSLVIGSAKDAQVRS